MATFGDLSSNKGLPPAFPPVDHVFPIVPVRQWVLSIPFAFRYRLAYDSGLLSDVLNVFSRVVFGELRRRARELLGLKLSQCGAVTLVQRCGDALNLAPRSEERRVGKDG